MVSRLTVPLLPMGDRALLLEVDSLEDVLALHAALEASRPPGVRRPRPGRAHRARARRPARAVARGGAGVDRSRPQRRMPQPRAAATPAVVELDVAYDGADLAETAALLGLSRRTNSSRRHAAAEWTVAFTGFAPGLRLPRQPRLAVRRAAPGDARARASRAARSASRPGSPAPIRARPRAAGG